MTTTATFRLSSDELDPSFIEKIKQLFAHREVEIIVREPGIAFNSKDKNEVLEATFGTWSSREFEEFERNTQPFREIDSKLWQ